MFWPSSEDFAAGHLVILMTAQDLAQGALARAVRAHDGVHFAWLDGEREAFEDFAFSDAGVEVFDDEGHDGVVSGEGWKVKRAD